MSSLNNHSWPPAGFDTHRRDARYSEARELLTATILGLALMATLTTWWWDAMR